MNQVISPVDTSPCFAHLHASSIPLDDDVLTLVAIFNRCFAVSHNTVLVSGDDEPVYLPASDECPQHRIIFAHGFFASALHEISHWCVAGPKRWLLEDFGYWYKPDGRTAAEQAEFEKVEIRPQAYEWLFTQASGRTFHFSADNLSSGIGASESFQKNVAVQAQAFISQYQHGTLAERPARLLAALQQVFATPPLEPDNFRID